jgi:hypothetical protein
MNKKRKDNKEDVDDILDEMEKMFGEDDFTKMLENMLRGIPLTHTELHGFRVKIKPDGTPDIKEINIMPKKKKLSITKDIESQRKPEKDWLDAYEDGEFPEKEGE